MLATKFHGKMGEGRNQEGNSRRWIISECESSLRRLKTDYIDLYQIHRPSPEIDIDETLSALSDLVHTGKIRLFREFDVPGLDGGGRSLRIRTTGPRAPFVGAASLLDAGARDRKRSFACLPGIRHGRPQLEPAGGRMALR